MTESTTRTPLRVNSNVAFQSRARFLVAGQRHAEADMRRRIPGAPMLVQELDL